MDSLTPEEKNVLEFVDRYRQTNGFSASNRDISSGCRISVPRVRQHLDALKGKGYIDMTPTIARSIRILKRPSSGCTCMVCRRELPSGSQPMEACPYCGSFTGWWIHASVKGEHAVQFVPD